jgi:uncharacterized membrane protein YgcG
MCKRVAGFLAFLFVLQQTLAAHAGPVEQMTQLAMNPANPDLMVVRYTWGGEGELRTTDRGKSWQLLCDALLFDPIQTHSGPTAVTGDGTTIMGVFNGIWHDDGHGCAWKNDAKYDGEWIGDVTPDPTDPNITYAITSTASPMGGHKLNGLLRRDATGTWSDLGTKEEMLATKLNVVVHGNGLRFYVTAVKGQLEINDAGGTAPNYATRVSDDQGQTWKELIFGTTDGRFLIQGVDPSNPDRIVASINRVLESGPIRDADDSVLVSTDQGAHFTEYMKVAEIGGVTFAPDGRVWIGDLGNVSDSTPGAPKGLWFAPNLDQPATKLAMGDYPVQCIGYQKATDTLYACQHFWFGSVKPDDGTFTSLVKFSDVKDFVSCPGVDMAKSCEMQLCGAYCGYGHFALAPVCTAYDTPTCGIPVVQAENGGSGGSGSSAGAGGGSSISSGGGGTAASGAFDAGGMVADSGSGTAAHKSSCSCRIVGANSAGGWPPFVVASLLASVLWVRRRRRG